MKIDTLAHVKNQLSAVVEQLGDEPLFITRNGKIAAVIQAVSDDEVEDYLLRNSAKFWDLIDARRAAARAGKTMSFDPARYAAASVSTKGMAVREKTAPYGGEPKPRKRSRRNSKE